MCCYRLNRIATVLCVFFICQLRLLAETPAGYVSLFNGRDLSGWKVPEGDNGHWKVVDGVIDYDALSEAKLRSSYSPLATKGRASTPLADVRSPH